MLTDLGHVSAHVVEAYKGCDGLLLSLTTNLSCLRKGPYPPMLKRRVGGPLDTWLTRKRRTCWAP